MFLSAFMKVYKELWIKSFPGKRLSSSKDYSYKHRWEHQYWIPCCWAFSLQMSLLMLFSSALSPVPEKSTNITKPFKCHPSGKLYPKYQSQILYALFSVSNIFLYLTILWTQILLMSVPFIIATRVKKKCDIT